MHDIVLECRGVSKRFGDHAVLHDVNLKIARGQIVSLVGPSGCGKSTLLRAILGTHPPDSGEVLMNGKPITGPGRDRGIVYQRYGLYPFLTARQNVAFGPMLDETNLAYRFFQFPNWLKLRKQHLAGADDMLTRVQMGKALHRYPEELSGGMCQRVAIAQALMMKPEILLLDEPFGALDEATREEMQEMLLKLYAENLAAKAAGKKPPYTILIITHELNEAIYVADRVLGLSQHWRWEDTGGPSHPGATIIYDAVSPVFSKDVEAEAAAFVRQREEMRRVIFEPSERFGRESHTRFWQQCAAGAGVGMMAPIP
ncbi:MAG: ABC transporter ATP-binding protein [Planctomycetia bacterium]|nr:ABC transporter ATP-binding protein [Planctomycetia bacterium]